MSRGQVMGLLAVLVLGTAGHWVCEASGGDRGRDFWTGALIHGVATVPYIWLCRAAVRGRFKPSFVTALGVVLLLRAVALPLEPALSDDIYRYLHEGTMVLEGHNPYLTAPADVPDDLRHPEYWRRINHKEIPAAYPPSLQFALAGGVLLQPTPLGMKILFAGCDVLVFVLLWLWLPVIGARAHLAIVYGFCPLLALEFAGEGHSDSFTVLFVVATLFAYSRQRCLLAGGLLAVATLGKFLPVVLLPFLLRRRLAAVIPFVLVVALCYFPFVRGVPLERWPELFEGFSQYASRWRGNDSGFQVAYECVVWLRDTLRELGWIDVQPLLDHYPHNVAKIPLAMFGLITLGLAWARRWPMQKVAAAVFMLFVSFTPTMHPWYLALLVPFLCLYPSTFWFAFTGTIYLAYHVRPEWLDAGKVAERLGLKIAEYVPFYLGFLSVLFDTRKAAAQDRQTRGS